MYRIKRISDDYLEHARDFKPKYKDKKLVNGKWRYYYDLGGNKNSYHNYKGKGAYYKTSGKEGSRYGTYERQRSTENNSIYNTDRVTVKKSNRLFSKSKSSRWGSTGSGMNSETVYEEGRLERGHRALNKKLNKGLNSASKSLNKHKKKTLRSMKKASDKGKSFMNKLFGGSKKKSSKKTEFSLNYSRR